MKYLQQPRGPGTAYRFRMPTPKSLQGMIDPETNKMFGVNIIRSLKGTRHLPTAKKLRDLRLAEVRAMEAEAIRGRKIEGRFGLERAEAWAKKLQAQSKRGGPDAYEPDIRRLIEEEVERAPSALRKEFRGVALSSTISVDTAVTQYLHDRRPGNGNDFDTLSQGTIRDLHVAVEYLVKFAGVESGKHLFLDNVDAEMIHEFRGDFLPQQTSPRAPSGLSPVTIQGKRMKVKTQ